MRLGSSTLAITFAIAALGFSGSIARAGDDGAAPLWVGIGSIFSPLVGFGSKDEKEAISYREHGKIVVPPSMDLPSPGSGPSADAGDWPLNQEIQRKKVQKEAAKKQIAGQGDARQRYSHPFPNAPVTVRAADQDVASSQCPGGKCESSSTLGNLNPMSWIGMGKTVTLDSSEPDREWLTDPPKGYRAPLAPVGQAAN
jgi:hypothetical protein